MVRINLIRPQLLADQHLIAEYNEILMLFGYVRRHPETGVIPDSYRLGPGHILFFKDKLSYLKRRHELLKAEMRRRGFKPEQTIRLADYPRRFRNDWEPRPADYGIIIQRLTTKLLQKPGWYRYEGQPMPVRFFLGLLSSPYQQ